MNYSIVKHHQVLDAIIAQDAEGAEKVMPQHLQVVMDNRQAILK